MPEAWAEPSRDLELRPKGSIRVREAFNAQMPNVRPPRTDKEVGTTVSDSGPKLNEANYPAGFSVTGATAAGHGAMNGIAVSADGALLAVTHYGDGSVSLIGTADGAARLTVTDIDEPAGVAISGDRVYVSTVSTADDEILALDTRSQRIVASYPVEFGLTDLVVSPNGRYIYAARSGADGAGVVVLNTSTGGHSYVRIDAATVGCVRISPDGRRLYVAANSASTAELVTIDTQRNRVDATVEIGSPIRDIALSPDGATAYVGSCGPDFGTVLDIIDTRTSTITATHKIGDAAGLLGQLTVSRDGERAYLVGDQNVTVLSTATQDVIGNIAVGGDPSCVVESPDGTRLYIADYAGTVTELAISVAFNTLTSDDEPTAAHPWAFSELMTLEPTLA
jgi:DNA-binding beta-propeller fold protein YncE